MIGIPKWIANYYEKNIIRSSCISPGCYSPSIIAGKLKADFVENYLQSTSFRRLVEDEDIKGPVAFLAPEAFSYNTGHNLLVDGGWTR